VFYKAGHAIPKMSAVLALINAVVHLLTVILENGRR
jgi:hypothetical protein